MGVYPAAPPSHIASAVDWTKLDTGEDSALKPATAPSICILNSAAAGAPVTNAPPENVASAVCRLKPALVVVPAPPAKAVGAVDRLNDDTGFDDAPNAAVVSAVA